MYSSSQRGVTQLPGGEQHSRIQQAGRVESILHRPKYRHVGRAVHALEPVDLGHTDSVFGADRAAELDRGGEHRLPRGRHAQSGTAEEGVDVVRQGHRSSERPFLELVKSLSEPRPDPFGPSRPQPRGAAASAGAAPGGRAASVP